MEAAYDGWADWYEGYLEEHGMPYALVGDVLADMLGPGAGTCLDYGCGVGQHLPIIASLGWRAVGLDLSADMLHRAASRSPHVIQGSAVALPIPSGSLAAVTTCLTHTDLDDVAPAFAEAARVLQPGGRFATVAVHPCFAGPTAVRQPDRSVSVSVGYSNTERQFVGQGVRARVGVRHVPLAELLTKIADAGFRLERVVEQPVDEVPLWLGLSATRG